MSRTQAALALLQSALQGTGAASIYDAAEQLQQALGDITAEDGPALRATQLQLHCLQRHYQQLFLLPSLTVGYHHAASSAHFA